MDLLLAATGLFLVTNVDDVVILALFFGQAAGRPGGARRVVVGQYLGFAGILAAAVAGGLGADALPEGAVPWLGLIPLAIGLRAGWEAWRERREEDDDAPTAPSERGPGIWTVAAVTFANGGDNVGVYIPVFARESAAGVAAYSAVFLVLVAPCCLVGHAVATRPAVARALGRWGDVVFAVVLVVLGVVILAEGLA
jgi:cadmium resistance protein CadD (predicted permease)